MKIRRPSLRFTTLLSLLALWLSVAALAQPPRPPYVYATAEPAYWGQSTTLSVDLTGGAIGPNATGTVVFSVDGIAVGSAPVSSAMASYTVAAPNYAIGQHTLTAQYSGDANYGPVTLTGTHQVIGDTSAVTLTVLTPTIFYGQTADAQATVVAVNAYNGATVNGGTLTFYIDNVNVCVLTVMSTPQNCPPSTGTGLAVGQHTIDAVYSGNQNYSGSTSNTGTIQVLPDVTTATLGSSVNPSTFGQSVTFTDAVTALYATAGGSVTFVDGGTVLGTTTLSTQGLATFATSALAVGTHNIVAQYNTAGAANPNFDASMSNTVVQVVNPMAQAASVTALSSSLNPSLFGQNVTFTATVVAGGTVPSGSVNFFDGTSPLATAALNAQGVATFATSALAVGSHAITAQYTGSTLVQGSTSAALSQQVNALGTADFVMTVTPTNFSVGAGAGYSLAININEVNGFSEPVMLSCAGQPSETSCFFGTALIPAGGGATRLQVTPSSAHFCDSSTPIFIAGSGGPGPRLPLLLAGGALGLALWTRRKRRLRGLALMAALGLLTALSGCGAGSKCTDFGVKPGTYTFTIVATAAGTPETVHTQAVTMTVTIQ